MSILSDAGLPQGGKAPLGSSGVRETTHVGAFLWDAEALYLELLEGVRAWLQPGTRLVGITSGGAWLAERLQADLQLPGKPGVISSAMHRDDFSQRGMVSGSGGQTTLRSFCWMTCSTPAAPSVPWSTSFSILAVLLLSSWPCWWTGVVANCRFSPTSLPSAWPCLPPSNWPWRVARRVPLVSIWRANACSTNAITPNSTRTAS